MEHDFYRSLDLINWEYFEWHLPTPSTDELIGSENDEGLNTPHIKQEQKSPLKVTGFVFGLQVQLQNPVEKDLTKMVKSQMKTKVSCGILFYTESFDGISFTEPQKIWENALVGSIGVFPDFALQAYPAGNFRLKEKVPVYKMELSKSPRNMH